MPILPPTCLFIRPAVTSAIISRSRGVSDSNRARMSESDCSWSRRFRSRSRAPVTASSISWSRNGLVRKSTAPAFHGLDRHRNIPMTGNENDWYLYAQPSQFRLEIEPTHPRHSDIEDETARDGGEWIFQQFCCGCERFHA